MVCHSLPLFRIQDFPIPPISHYLGCGGDGKYLMIIVYLDYCLLACLIHRLVRLNTFKHVYTRIHMLELLCSCTT